MTALARFPGNTVINGEIVTRRWRKPSFSALQNEGSSQATIVYYVFDVMSAPSGEIANPRITLELGYLSRGCDTPLERGLTFPLPGSKMNPEPSPPSGTSTGLSRRSRRTEFSGNQDDVVCLDVQGARPCARSSSATSAPRQSWWGCFP